MQTNDVILLPQDNEDPFGFDSIDLDGVNEDNGFNVVTLNEGVLIGVAGITIPADDDFDAVYGFISGHGKSKEPFRNLDDAVNGLLRFVDSEL
jgi:hypothetical protein